MTLGPGQPAEPPGDGAEQKQGHDLRYAEQCRRAEHTQEVADSRPDLLEVTALGIGGQPFKGPGGDVSRIVRRREYLPQSFDQQHADNGQ
jgi:hypothetical protein